jgi:FixJ family two-component response regulator
MTKVVAIVDDDDLMRSALQGLLKAVGLQRERSRPPRNSLTRVNSTTRHA